MLYSNWFSFFFKDVIQLSLDGVAVRILALELNDLLKDSKIDKIMQPSVYSVVMQLRKNSQTYRLLVSINPQNVRLSITEQKLTNPQQAPLFCMVLRKHLNGSIIESIEQVDWERMIAIKIRGHNEVGDETVFTLMTELMGKSSNIILLDNNNKILDAARRIGIGSNQFRQIQPGLIYKAPPKQNKVSLDQVTHDWLQRTLINASSTLSIRRLLLNHLAGIGPQTARHLVESAGLSTDATNEYLGENDYQNLYSEITHLKNLLTEKTWQPNIIYDDTNHAIAFAPFPLAIYDLPCKYFDRLNHLLEYYYYDKELQESFSQKKASLNKIIQHEKIRCEKKLALQLDKVLAAEDADIFRLYGELLTANLYRIKQGPSATVENFYEPDTPSIEIPLNPIFTPNENAQIFFNKYNKAKNGAKKASEQAAMTQEELDYLISIADSLGQAENFTDLQDIRLELEDSGYARRRTQRRKDKQPESAKPLSITYRDYEILVGKNNRQNDQLTMKTARGNDLWLHTKDIHGAHVIIRHKFNQEFPNQVIEVAAELAAWFSKARFGKLVPVDITLKKHVHKPNGARPGMVIYTNQETVFVTPDTERITNLLASNQEVKNAY